MKQKFTLISLMLLTCVAKAQETTVSELAPLKHYMPLYIDIPCELNVQKGFKEIDIATGFASFDKYNGTRGLIEYDFSPLKGLGFEIELPFHIVQEKEALPDEEGGYHEEGNSLHSLAGLRVGFNYSFLVLPKAQTTLSFGYFNELETSPFKEFGKPLFAGNVYSPYIAAAKVWGKRFHTLIYTGPSIKQEFEENRFETQWKLNTTLSYRYGRAGRESFAGVEVNQSVGDNGHMELLLRPQVQVAFTEKWSLGIVTTIPVKTESGINGGGFLRLIFLPGN